MINGLADRLTTADGDDHVEVIALTGAGSVSSAGIDLTMGPEQSETYSCYGSSRDRRRNGTLDVQPQQTEHCRVQWASRWKVAMTSTLAATIPNGRFYGLSTSNDLRTELRA